MGSADIVPGVSGGTMALIVGVYERLIQALSEGFGAVLKLVRGDARGALADLKALDWGLLAPLLLGIGLALVTMARVIPPLLEAYPVQMHGLFFGLVGASIAIPAMRVRRMKGRLMAAFGVAALAAFVLTGLPAQATATEPGLIRVFLSAAVAICAMILPGVSGAFLLKVMGMYEATLAAVNARDLAYVVVFALGAGIGLGTFSKLLHYLLDRAHDWTMIVLAGLMLGALRALWPWGHAEQAVRLPLPGEPIGSTLGLMTLGFVLVGALVVYEVRKRGAEPDVPESDLPE